MTVGKKVLIVGAGGIGCELLKDLMLLDSPLIQGVDLVDLDTIDISNLNRQFLFQKCHVSQSKAKVAKESIQKHYRPHGAPIVAHHANIKDPIFDVPYFRQFDIVLNALDNIDARRYVNYMCCLANVPLVESGTAGYHGQVTVIQKGVTECFDCSPKQAPTTFPVCTIRSTPTALIHTIVWAKDFLLYHLFGSGSEDEQPPPPLTDQDSTNQEEKNALNQESLELSVLVASKHDAGFPLRMISTVFIADIQRLAAIDELWKSRAQPVPLDLSPKQLTDLLSAETVDYASVHHDLQVLRVQDSVKLLMQSTLKLMARRDSVVFDKDDMDTLDFVCAAANLRATCFGIPNESRFTMKAMAGNIIPAIATTNAVIAGLATIEAMKILSDRPLSDCIKTYYVPTRHDMIFTIEKLSPPNPDCLVCQKCVALVKCNTAKTRVSDLLEAFGTTHVTLSEGSRILYDPELESHVTKSLESLGLGHGKILQLDPEDDTMSPWIYILDHREEDGHQKEVVLQVLYQMRRPMKRSQENMGEAEEEIQVSDTEQTVKKFKSAM